MVEHQNYNQLFLQSLVEIIQKNIGDENFGAREFAEALGISQRKLSRKVRAITNKSVSGLICEIRLQRAMELLQKEDLTVAEVAYKVGFSSATYFNKCFHLHFGYPPGRIRKGDLDDHEPANPDNVSSMKFLRKPLLLKVLYIFIGLLFITGLFLTADHIFKMKTATVTSSAGAGKFDKSIAVLPFKNDSPDKENEYFCNGIMEEILNQLQNISDLKVKSRTSSELYRDTQKDIREIGKELNVSMIIEGSIRKIGNNLRITTQLINSKTGDNLWCEVYDGKYTTDIFNFQTNVAKKVAGSLNAIITPDEEKIISTAPTENILAYDLNLKGAEMIRKWQITYDTNYLNLALNALNQSLKIEPGHRKALLNKLLIFIEAGKTDSALVYLRQITKLYPDYIAALDFAVLYFYSNQPDSALKYGKIAVKNDPNFPWTNLCMGQILLLFRKDIEKALPYFTKANELSQEKEYLITFQIALVYASIGEYQKALKYYEKTLSLRPDFKFVKGYCVLMSYTGEFDKALRYQDSICNINEFGARCDILKFYIKTIQKDYKEAERFYNKATKAGYIIKEDDYPFIAYLYKETGRVNEAVALLKNSIKNDENRIISYPNYFYRVASYKPRLAASYALLGDKTNAIRQLSESGELGLYSNALFRIDKFPGFNDLQNDPDFKKLLRRRTHLQDSLKARLREIEESGELHL